MRVANLRSRFASSRSGSSSDMRSSPYAYRDAAVVRGKDQNPVRSGGLRRLGQLASKREASEGSGSVCQATLQARQPRGVTRYTSMAPRLTRRTLDGLIKASVGGSYEENFHRRFRSSNHVSRARVAVRKRAHGQDHDQRRRSLDTTPDD